MEVVCGMCFRVLARFGYIPKSLRTAWIECDECVEKQIRPLDFKQSSVQDAVSANDEKGSLSTFSPTKNESTE